MTRLDLPAFTNGGGLLLALLMLVIVAVSVLGLRRPRCWRCGRRLGTNRPRLFLATREGHVPVCGDCFSVAACKPPSRPSPFRDAR